MGRGDGGEKGWGVRREGVEERGREGECKE